MQQQSTFKVLLIGNSGVGKSCILMRFSQNLFTNDFYNTIGVDFKLKSMVVDGKKIKLQLWDTAGQDRFRTITNNYYRGANGIIIVYDITDRDSFENVKNWYNQISKNTKDNVAKVLVGNKLDMQHKRRVQYSQGLQLGQQYGIPFLQTSAKDSSNVNNLFENIAKRMVEIQEDDPQMRNRIKLKPPQVSSIKPIKNSSCCC